MQRFGAPLTFATAELRASKVPPKAGRVNATQLDSLAQFLPRVTLARDLPRLPFLSSIT